MPDLTAIEIKAFVPAKDFALSKSFYQDLGFVVSWSDADLAYLKCGESSFLLQNLYEPEHAAHFMMHLLTANVDAWWKHVEAAQLAVNYGVLIEPLADRPWGLRDFAIADPSGVLWRIGQSIKAA